MRLKPIEGNGWYLGVQRRLPPPPFSVQVTRTEGEGGFSGSVDDNSSELDGYEILASPSFVGRSDFMAVVLSNRALGCTWTGYVLLEELDRSSA